MKWCANAGAVGRTAALHAWHSGGPLEHVWRRLARAGLAGAGSVLLLAACGGPPASAPPPVAQAPTTAAEGGSSAAPPVARTRVRAAYAIADGMVAPMWLALSAGLWQQHGLDVELSLITGTPNVMAALINNDVQFVQSAGDSGLRIQARDPDVVALLNPSRTSPHRLLAAPAIERVEDLRGRRIGVAAIGDGGYVLTSKALQQLGFNPEREVLWVPLGTGSRSEFLAALAAGAIDATLLTPPGDLLAIQQGAHVLFNYADLGLPFAGLPVYTYRRTLEQRRSIVEAFVAGLIDGIRLFKADPARGKEILTQRMALSDPEILEWTYESLRGPRMSERPFLDLEQNRAIVDALVADEPELQAIQLSRVLDNSILEDLDRRGYLASP